MGRRARRFWPALALVLAAVMTLGGCGKSLDELLNQSQIHTVRVEPEPVPAPSPQGNVAFDVRVDFDSNTTQDVLRVWLRNPNDGGRYVEIGYWGTCSTASTACGNATERVPCFSAYGGSVRELRCTGGQTVNVAPGTHRLRVEIQSCGRFSGCGPVHDSYELDFTLR
jgi:hypothetical protein